MYQYVGSQCRFTYAFAAPQREALNKVLIIFAAAISFFFFGLAQELVGIQGVILQRLR